MLIQKKGYIVIATENDEFRTFLANSFHKIGWIVYPAKNGKQSTSLVLKFHPDVVIMDIEMPVRDGITACRLIKNDMALTHNYSVILMGKTPNRKKIINAIDAGCDDFILKPFKFDELLTKVNAFVDFYHKKKVAKVGLSHQDKEEEHEIIVYSRKVIKNIFSNAMHGKLIDYPVVQNVVNKMKEILYKESYLPLAFKMKSYNDYTYIHSINVASLCMSFAYHLDWCDRDLQLIGEGAFLHDIGKTKINLQILMKPGNLTEIEFSEIKKHPLYAKDVIANSKINYDIMGRFAGTP